MGDILGWDAERSVVPDTVCEIRWLLDDPNLRLGFLLLLFAGSLCACKLGALFVVFMQLLRTCSLDV